VKSEKAKDQLISRISGLLGEFTSERDRSLRDAFEEMHNKNVIGEGEMEKCGNENGERIVNVIRAGEDWGNSLTRRGGESKRLRDGAFKVSSTFDVGAKGSDTTCTTGVGFLAGNVQIDASERSE
jgi:kinesin family protein 11